MSTAKPTPRKPARRRKKVADEEMEFEKIEIDLLMVADWAETINGKLYIQGGGWDRKLLSDGDPIELALAATILVPWNLTNQEIQLSFSLETGDGAPVDQAVKGVFKIGRPANAVQGQRLRTPLVGRIRAKVPGLGAYQVRLVINNDVAKNVVFYVVEKL